MFNLFRSISVDYETDKIKNQDKSCDLSCLVDYTSKLSNLFEDFKKLDDFVWMMNYSSEGSA